MDADALRLLHSLLRTQPVATLATWHGGGDAEPGEPATSMVPVVFDPAGAPGPCCWIHVSALSPHTRDMARHPRVSLLWLAPHRPAGEPGLLHVDNEPDPVPVQALPRVSLQADAAFLSPDDPHLPAARALYLARFPAAAQTFELADFSLVRLRPVSARIIGGFGRAHAVAGEALLTALRAVIDSTPA